MYLGAQRSMQYGFLAANMTIGRASASAASRDAKLDRIVERLGMMHGLPQKIGQLLSFSEIDSSHEGYSKLNENKPSLSFDEAKTEFERQLGTSLESNFSEFNPIGIAASIGQVHKARLHDGRPVAVKIQYPGIQHSVRYDLNALGWLMKPIGGLKKGFDVASYKQEIGESLYRELDYSREAENTKRFSSLLNSSQCGKSFFVQLPNVFDRLSSNQVLTTSWIEGDSISSILDWDPSKRLLVSESLVELFLKSLLEWGFVHADPNPGNYRFTEIAGRPCIGLIDFGCVKEIDPQFKEQLHTSVFNLSPQLPNASQALDAFQQMGFNAQLLQPLKDALPQVLATLKAPFLQPGPFDTRSWKLSAALKKSLGEHRMNFRMAGPSDLLFILRAFQGLVQFLNALDAPVDWKPILSRIQKPFTPKEETAQTLRPANTAPTRPAASETLNIQVEENGALKAKLAFAANATDSLDELMPDDVRQRIAARKIDLQKIIRKSQANNYAPGELFSLTHGPKSVKVWLD